MELVNSLSAKSPLCYDTGCRLYMPSSFLEKSFKLPYIEYTTKGRISKKEREEKYILKEWDKLRFLYNCMSQCTDFCISQDEVDYLLSDSFKTLCNIFQKAYPPVIDEDGCLIIKSFDEPPRTYVPIANHVGEYCRYKIEYFPERVHYMFKPLRKEILRVKLEILKLNAHSSFINIYKYIGA